MSLKIRADVARVARDIVPQWPLHSFIAVNPLGGREGIDFESIRDSGIALTRSTPHYLADVQSGRITRENLSAAVIERIPELRAHSVRIGSRTISAAKLIVAELTELAPAAETVRASQRSDVVDEMTAKWVASFLDPHPLWPMPHRRDGFYAAWRALARHDPAVSRSARRAARTLPARADDAIGHALSELKIGTADADAVLRRQLAGLPGWTAHIKWRAEHVGDIDVVEYLAVRLSLHLVLGQPVEDATPSPSDGDESPWTRAIRLVEHLHGGADRGATASVARVLAMHPVRDHPFTFQRAYELQYAGELLRTINGTADDADTADPVAPRPDIADTAGTVAPRPGSAGTAGTAGTADTVAPRPDTQLVACIDPRSEGIRRHLEQLHAGIETFGFAGFFGIPIRFASYNSSSAIDSLPALLAPHHRVTERPRDPASAQQRTARLGAHQAFAAGIHAGESTTAAPFAFAETTGVLFGAMTVLRTLAPTIAARCAAALTSTARSESSVTVADAFTLDERAGLAEAALRMMGLSQFAPLVIFAGHGSTSTNNLYESSLDCGACGGNPGTANARSAAAIFNDPDVRRLLHERGLPIPSDTFFLAAAHDTVTDRIRPLDAHLVPPTHLDRVERFARLQHTASDALVRERAHDLPGASPRRTPDRTRARGDDWAEVYPEWGLAGNAAFIIGPREITYGQDLKRRVFLHSYRPETDPNGAGLETILTAPVVVAQWINHQYYFSALNPDTLGAGTKTVHNAIGTLGVLSGQAGDLRRGLPWQSVAFAGRLVHEPMRLAVIVEAPLDRISAIVSRNAVLRSLFDNNWISLTARENSGSAWYSYGRYGWSPTRQSNIPHHEGAAQ